MKINFLSQMQKQPIIALALVAALIPLTPIHEILSSKLGPKIVVSQAPKTVIIEQNTTFSYRADASDDTEIDRVEIYANGARVKICPTASCDFTATYWTNGASKRDIHFSSAAYNKSGYMNRSDELVLTVIDTQSTSTQDAESGISYKTWVDAKNLVLNTGEKTAYHVEAKDADGLNHADIWVNGSVKTVCNLINNPNCNHAIDSKDYPDGTEIFVNSDIHDNAGKNAWTPGVRMTRPVANQPIILNPVIAKATLTVTPNKDIRRGTIVNAHTEAIETSKGLSRIDIYLNNTIANACSFGTAVSLVSCDVSIDTNKYPEGSVLTIASRGINSDGNDIWSNEQTLIIGASLNGDASADQSGVYLSGSADRTEAANGETVNYTALGWSPNGNERLTIFRDGIRIGDCPSDICRVTIQADGKPIIFTARLLDGAGKELWIKPQTVKRK